MNKNELLDQINAGYASFMELVDRFDSGEMLRPGMTGVWSVKDLLAHLAVHQRRMVEWMEEKLQGGMPLAAQPYDMPEDELAQVNRSIYEDNRDRALENVLADLETAHRGALALVEGAAEDDLFDPRRCHLRGGEPLWEAVAANTCWHYQEHSLVMAGYLQGRKVRP